MMIHEKNITTEIYYDVKNVKFMSISKDHNPTFTEVNVI